MFDGEPIDEHTKEMIRISLENSMQWQTIRQNKNSLPNKYKRLSGGI
ncbi:hypothetical protein ACT7CX_29300 [Bacillus cereus]